MTSKEIGTAQPFVYNMTMIISQELSDKWLEAMTTAFLPACTDGKVIIASQINEILVQTEEGDKNYAVQFMFASQHIFEKEGLPALGEFLKMLDAQFLKQYVYFTTKMSVLYENHVHSDN